MTPDQKNRINHFCVSLLAVVLLPLGPIILEGSFTGNISGEALTITATIYTITIGVSSREIIMLLLCFMFAVVMSGLYARVLYSNHASMNCFIMAGCAILVVAILHIMERKIRHLNEGEKFYAKME